MKFLFRKILITILAFCMVLSIFGCSGSSDSKESMVFTWDAVDGAVYYEYNYISNNIGVSPWRTDRTSVEIPKGCRVSVCPIMADGSRGDVLLSDFNGGDYALSGDDMAAAHFTIDDSGLVSWEPEYSAISYECKISDSWNMLIDTYVVTEPCITIPAGTCVTVVVSYSDGTMSEPFSSGLYGNPSDYTVSFDNGDDERYGSMPDLKYNITWDQLLSFDVIKSIRWDTVQTNDQGLLTFIADGPHGDMRFECSGVTAADGQLTFAPGSRIWGLDAIGRICLYDCSFTDAGTPEDWVHATGGYSFDGAASVDSHEDLIFVWGQMRDALSFNDDGNIDSMTIMDYQPNFIAFGSSESNPNSITMDSLIVYYDEATFSTGIRYMGLWSHFYGTYLAGEYYDPTRELFDSDNGIFDFYLLLVPDVQDAVDYYDPTTTLNEDILVGRSLIDLRPDQYTVGELRKPDGTIADKNEPLESGYTLDVTVGNYTYPILLPIYDLYNGGQNMHDLVPYGYPEATGDLNVLVVPVSWQDQPENANNENRQMIYSEVGRVMENGTVTDYSQFISNNTRFSLSEYFDIASYGKLKINSFVTDWYTAPYNYEEYWNMSSNDADFLDNLYAWLQTTYPDTDWSDFDKDANGFFDAVVMVNVGEIDVDGFGPLTFSGGAHHLLSYNGGNAGTPAKPTINSIININKNLFGNNTLIHEFGHVLGLIDYYDVTYSGIDAVGNFDMQSASCGDWNAYSKYAAGWIDPVVVKDLSPGESVEITIGAFSETGNSIVIPVLDSFDGPFNEYIMIDLFTPEGVNVYDAAAFGLDKAAGVRIYHVDARMEVHIEDVNGVSYLLGTPVKVNALNDKGAYHIELIQAGGTNTFTNPTNLRTNITSQDLFRAGMTFSIDKYSQFFYEGKMNDGSSFDYEITVVSVNTDNAVIRITAK